MSARAKASAFSSLKAFLNLDVTQQAYHEFFAFCWRCLSSSLEKHCYPAAGSGDMPNSMRKICVIHPWTQQRQAFSGNRPTHCWNIREPSQPHLIAPDNPGACLAKAKTPELSALGEKRRGGQKKQKRLKPKPKENRAAGNYQVRDTTKRASQSLTPIKKRFPKVSQKWLDKPRGIPQASQRNGLKPRAEVRSPAAFPALPPPGSLELVGSGDEAGRELVFKRTHVPALLYTCFSF